MKKLITLGALTAILGASSVQADMVCQGSTVMGPVTVTVKKDQAIVSGGALTRPLVYKNLKQVYDGHEIGLITDAGLSIRYSDDFGCFRDVEIVTNVRHMEDGGPDFITTFHVALCTGGTTADEICQGSQP